MLKRTALPILMLTLGTTCATPVFAADADTRQLVEMPPEARAALRAEMLDFQSALHGIISALADKDYTAAADMAEKQVGISAMGRHRSSPPNARPGMFMPSEMHLIARTMHAAGSDFAKVAKAGDTSSALKALQEVSGACVSCHRTYRVQ